MAKKQKTKVKTNKRLPHVPQFVQEFALGGPVGIPRNPSIDLYENQIMMANAQRKSNNFLTGALDLAGAGAMGIGMGKMAQGIQAGEGVTEGGFNYGNLIQGGIGALGTFGPMFALGGIAGENIEVEGGEIMETPMGEMMEMQGPSHEQGGIGVNVPNGTEIYSDRLLGEDGKTMAQRKKARERILRNLERKLKDNNGDATLQKAYNRTKKNFEALDAKDMEQMMQAQQMEQQMQGIEPVEEFALGGRVQQKSLSRNPMGVLDTNNFFGQTGTPYTATGMVNRNAQSTLPKGSAGLTDMNIQGPEVDLNFDYFNEPTGGKTGLQIPPIDTKGMNPLGNATAGDILGVMGETYNTFAPMQNTLKSRATDTVNTNQFADFGKRGLEKLGNSKQFLQGQKDNQEQQAALQSSTARARNRGSARGVNTMRAMDIATDMQEKTTLAQIQDNYARQMQSIFSQEAQMMNQQDQMVMQGEAAADLANRQDKDAFYTNLAKDISTKGRGIANMGKNLNDFKTRDVTQNTLNSMFPNFKYNSSTGEVEGVKEVVDAHPTIFGQITSKEVQDEVIIGLATNKYKVQGNNIVNLETGKTIDLKTGK